MSTDFRKSLQRILADRKSGSSAIARRSCRLLDRLAEGSLGQRRREQVVHALNDLRSTFPVMGVLRALDRDVEYVLSRHADESPAVQADKLHQALSQFQHKLTTNLTESARRMARHARRRHRFLTLSASGAVAAAAEALQANPDSSASREPLFVVCESRPAREGIAMARRIEALGWPVRVILDAAMGQWIRQVDAVVLGADWVDPDGFVNKIGSLALSDLAARHKRPVYVIADSFRIQPYPPLDEPAAELSPDVKSGHGGDSTESVFERIPWQVEHILCTENGLVRPKRGGALSP